MLSANAVFVIAGVAVIAVVIVGLARGVSWRSILMRSSLVCAVAWIVAVTLFPIPVDPGLWESFKQFSRIQPEPFGTIGWQLAHGLERYEARQLFGNIALFAHSGSCSRSPSGPPVACGRRSSSRQDCPC